MMLMMIMTMMRMMTGEQLDRKAGIEGMGFPPLEDIIHALSTVAVSSKNNCSNNLKIVSIFIANF